MNERQHVVIGSGPLGQEVAAQLIDAGHEVRLISRTPRMVARDHLEQVSCDASDSRALAPLIEGAATVYHCANAPYHRWPQLLPSIWNGILDACRTHGSLLVIATNLYALGRPEPGAPLSPTTQFAPCTVKGRVRETVERRALEVHRNGEATVALVRASDFYGPLVRESVLGESFFTAAHAGKRASLFGSPDAFHSYAYLPDFARTMVAVGATEEPADWGRSWIVPHDRPVTAGEVEQMVIRIKPGFSLAVMKRGTVRFGGLFIRAAREMVEMLYEFEHDFIADGSETTDRFGLSATELETGLQRTYDYWADPKDR